MNIMVIGAAGVIGSALTRRFVRMGMRVRCMDICRVDEAWRLADVDGYRSMYVWKASNDLVRGDLDGIDAVIDCGLGVADRPLGNSSPSYTVDTNLSPSFHILETVRHMDADRRPHIVYPSSFNTLYGHPPGSTYAASTLPNPSSLYGWTKAVVELLYTTYHKAHGIRCTVTRVGSGYGPRMRSDEFPARLILNMLRNEATTVRSPQASRLWTYGEDIVDFYAGLIEDLDRYDGRTLHCAGNADDRIVTNTELARLVADIAGRPEAEIREGPYEPGEMVDGRPVSFVADHGSPLWNPRVTLRQGMERTFGWFGENLSRYS